MNAPPDRLLTDSLLLDAAEGIERIAARLVDLYDRAPAFADPSDLATLGQVLTELGWWQGRLTAGLSDETAAALGRIASDDD